MVDQAVDSILAEFLQQPVRSKRERKSEENSSVVSLGGYRMCLQIMTTILGRTWRLYETEYLGIDKQQAHLEECRLVIPFRSMSNVLITLQE